MKPTTLYYAILGATIPTEIVALGINTNNIPKGLKRFKETIKNNSVPLAVSTGTLPLAIDAALTGKPLTATGMFVLTGTNAVKIIKKLQDKSIKTKNKTDKKDILEKIIDYANPINAVASGLSLGQNFVTGNPKVMNCLPPALFMGVSLRNQMIESNKKNEDSKKNEGSIKTAQNEKSIQTAQKVSNTVFMIAALILAHNLRKAGKTPQALLAFNLAFIVGKKIHDDGKKNTADTQK